MCPTETTERALVTAKESTRFGAGWRLAIKPHLSGAPLYSGVKDDPFNYQSEFLCLKHPPKTASLCIDSTSH